MNIRKSLWFTSKLHVYKLGHSLYTGATAWALLVHWRCIRAWALAWAHVYISKQFQSLGTPTFSSDCLCTPQFLHTVKTDHLCHAQYIHCSHPQHNSLSMHIKMHYTPTTDPTAFHNPSLHTTNKHKAYLCKWRQNGTRCRDDVKVLWCHSHLVWLVCEASIPTCTCFPSENFLWLVQIHYMCNIITSEREYLATLLHQ